MIGWLQGEVRSYQRDGSVVVDVRGVGYSVHVGASAIFSRGEEIELFVYTVVRADAIVLYGFPNESDREFFELLLLTPGVGPATALAALRSFGRDQISAAIEAGDVKALTAIPGIGAKTASRIVLELKGKIVVNDAAPASVIGPATGAIEDGLRALGYSLGEIRQSLAGVTLSGDESIALREALQLLRRP